MKHDKALCLLQSLGGTYDEASIRRLAESFGLSFGEAAGIAGFYSRLNGLPAEERLDPVLMAEGPLIRHGKERPWCALPKAKAAPDTVIDTLLRSGLSGRGGAAFPTGEKWRAVQKSGEREKYVICNVSEGESGTAKDLWLLLNQPEAVIEGIAICALAVGAEKAFAYVREGYSDAAESLRAAISSAKDALDFLSIEVIENAGAYVCGEETALIASLEGRRGEPGRKPPYPTAQGLLGKATVINNAETFACVPLIIDMGAESFRENESRLFTVTGCGAECALCEMPLTSSPGELFKAARCGGEAKAFQLGGGVSGLIYPGEYMSLPFSSPEGGSGKFSLGAGSLRFIGEDESLSGLCAEILEFYTNESCGKCTPCRYGCRKLLKMLRGGGSPGELKALAVHISSSAFCPLGKSVGNALCSAMEHFPHEFQNDEGEERWL